MATSETAAIGWYKGFESGEDPGDCFLCLGVIYPSEYCGFRNNTVCGISCPNLVLKHDPYLSADVRLYLIVLDASGYAIIS